MFVQPCDVPLLLIEMWYCCLAQTFIGILVNDIQDETYSKDTLVPVSSLNLNEYYERYCSTLEGVPDDRGEGCALLRPTLIVRQNLPKIL